MVRLHSFFLWFLLAVTATPAFAQEVLLPADPPPARSEAPDPVVAAPQRTGPSDLELSIPPDPDPDYAFARAWPDHAGAVAKGVRDGCSMTSSFDVQLEIRSFFGQQQAQQNFPGHARQLAASFENICQDNRSRLIVDRLLGILVLRNEPGRSIAVASGRGHTITVSYDFSLIDPPDPRTLTPALQRALGQLFRDYQIARRGPVPPQEQDEEP